MAFGEETSTAQRVTSLGYQPTNEVRQGYTGYEPDTESGLDFAQARYYNSAHGRFTSADPLTASANLKNPQTFNRYSYVLNSPYKYTDPLGLISQNTGANGGRAWCSTCESRDENDNWTQQRQDSAGPSSNSQNNNAGPQPSHNNQRNTSEHRAGPIRPAGNPGEQGMEYCDERFVVPNSSVFVTEDMPYQMQNNNPNYPNYDVNAYGQGATPSLFFNYSDDDIGIVNLSFEVEELDTGKTLSSTDGTVNLSNFILDELIIPSRGLMESTKQTITSFDGTKIELTQEGGPRPIGIPTEADPRIRNLRVTVKFPQCGKTVPYTYQLQLRVWVDGNGVAQSKVIRQ